MKEKFRAQFKTKYSSEYLPPFVAGQPSAWQSVTAENMLCGWDWYLAWLIQLCGGKTKTKNRVDVHILKHIFLELQSITSIITMLNLDLETGSTMATRTSRLITIYRYRKQLHLHHTYICIFTRITVKNNGLI